MQFYARSRTIPRGYGSEKPYIRKLSILANVLLKKGSANFKFKTKHPSEMNIPTYSIEK